MDNIGFHIRRETVFILLTRYFFYLFHWLTFKL